MPDQTEILAGGNFFGITNRTLVYSQQNYFCITIFTSFQSDVDPMTMKEASSCVLFLALLRIPLLLSSSGPIRFSLVFPFFSFYFFLISFFLTLTSPLLQWTHEVSHFTLFLSFCFPFSFALFLRRTHRVSHFHSLSVCFFLI